MTQTLFPFGLPFISNNVMFDPSLLISPETVPKVIDFMMEYSDLFRFYISPSFYRTLKEYDETERGYRIAEFFGYKEKYNPQEIRNLLEDHKEFFTFFDVPKEVYAKKFEYFYENLSMEIEDKRLIDILFEEWIFLQEFSWVVASSKKVFEKFKESGSISIEFSKKAVDKITRLTLKKEGYEHIRMIDTFRVIGKFIAVGGSAAASFLNPYHASLLTFSTGVFLLIDP